MKIDVKHVAKLANLPLSEEEIKKFEEQLSETLTHIENLKEIDSAHTPPTNQVTNVENVLREDIVTPSLSQEDALKNAKAKENGSFKVASIFEN